MKQIQVPADFTLEVFAHEPDVMHPIAMTWDERGRLFVLITKDYPNERKESGGSDYILMCEDTNKDGKSGQIHTLGRGSEYSDRYGVCQRGPYCFPRHRTCCS